MLATRVALTVKDFNYYMGHAYVSLSRLHINMMATPPRTIRLTAPKRTEMRRMVQQMRSNAPPRRTGRGEAPSGYIVDISRDDAPGESTRAIVNRGDPVVQGGRSEGGRGAVTREEGGEGGASGSSNGGGGSGAGRREGGSGAGGGESATSTSASGTSGGGGGRGPNSRYKTGIPSLGQLLPGMGYEVSQTFTTSIYAYF